MTNLDTYIDGARKLPPAPQILPKLMQLLRDTDADATDVVNYITYDPALTASVLRMCNSAYFGSASPAADLNEAILRIGFSPVYQIAAAALGERVFGPSDKASAEIIGQLWQHSVTSAVGAQMIARDLGHNENEVFTIGLLHDIGKLILAEAIPDYLSNYSGLESTHHDEKVALETKTLGLNHAAVGGRLLERWKFPPHLVAAVTWHHNPSAAGDEKIWAAYACLGDAAARLFKNGNQAPAIPSTSQAEATAILNLKPGALNQYTLQIVEELEYIGSLMNVN